MQEGGSTLCRDQNVRQFLHHGGLKDHHDVTLWLRRLPLVLSQTRELEVRAVAAVAAAAAATGAVGAVGAVEQGATGVGGGQRRRSWHK